MKNDRDIAAVILAAGQGTRMNSDLAKVLHKVAGKSMIRHVIDAVSSLSPERLIVVVGHQAEAVKEESRGGKVRFALQSERLGTGHAVLQAQPLLDDFSGTVMVLTGDTPMLRGSTLRALLEHHIGEKASATVLSAVFDEAGGYGRIVKDEKDQFLKIVEDRDASEEEKAIREINSGIFCFQSEDLFPALRRVGRGNKQKEYYLTDVIGILREDGKKTAVFLCGDGVEVRGINDIEQLKEAERLMIKDG
ncbi:MAG: NTP transferase domain-containing protein [Candidatus Krumholzibacteriota bacterium]|nr:NTP transferase domain-containing protein [Candidatus Krumholzibacteriota bacterium]